MDQPTKCVHGRPQTLISSISLQFIINTRLTSKFHNYKIIIKSKKKIMKPSKRDKPLTTVKINMFLLFFLTVVSFSLLLLPTILTLNSVDDDDHTIKKIKDDFPNLVVVEEEKKDQILIPNFLIGRVRQATRVALVNVEEKEWPAATGIVEEVRFEKLPSNLTWTDFFPEWIDEEEENEVPTCPDIPMPEWMTGAEPVDLVVVGLPCDRADVARRELARLQVHLVAAEVAVRRGRRDVDGKVRVVFYGKWCSPMMEIFRCDDVVKREGKWWLYEVKPARLEAKLALPVGSCKLALDLKKEEVATNAQLPPSTTKSAAIRKPEAYATVIHTSTRYVCGAITLARSLLSIGTTRDLVLLHDESIPEDKLKALASTGWKLHLVTRIRNPHAKTGSYNAYNYTKLRLWLLTGYSKVVFIDADVLVLRNLDALFRLPELSATGNHKVLFNSGVMVIEPSRCTFQALMRMRKEIVPYNGGDQGFLNEVFVWWHRLPHKVNFMKNFWSNTTEEEQKKNRLFRSDPPELYSIHYLGMKPWTCYRDYDCNWNLRNNHVYASDDAHRTWWVVYDNMPKRLRRFCGLTAGRKASLERHRRIAREGRYPDGHWKIEKISDKRSRQ